MEIFSGYIIIQRSRDPNLSRWNSNLPLGLPQSLVRVQLRRTDGGSQIAQSLQQILLSNLDPNVIEVLGVSP